MLSALTPLSIGAAATAISSAAGVIPTPGEFATALKRAVERPNETASDAASTPTPISSTAESRTELRRLLRDVEKSLAKLLGREDVDTSKPIRFKLDGAGVLRANSDHPDAAKIDAKLAGDTNLSAVIAKALRSINAATSPELLADVSRGGASIGEPTLTFLDGSLTASLA